jgi:hypothetical protein
MNKEIKVAVVTAIFLMEIDKMDEPAKNFTVEKSWDYILFTNKLNVECSDIWQIREIDCSKFNYGVHATKYVKWLTHILLPDYDVIIWVDSFMIPNIQKIDEIQHMIKTVAETDNLLYIRTQHFNNVNDDIEWCLKNNRINKNMASDIINYLSIKENFSVHENMPTFWSASMIKNNKCEALKKMANELFHLIKTVGYRDQHWLPMLFNKYKIKTNVIKNDSGKCWIVTNNDIFIEPGKRIKENHDYLTIIK